MFSGKTAKDWAIDLALLLAAAGVLGLAAGLEWADRTMRLYAASTFKGFPYIWIGLSLSNLLLGATLVVLAWLANPGSGRRLLFAVFLIAGSILASAYLINFFVIPLSVSLVNFVIPSIKPSDFPSLPMTGPKLELSAGFLAALGALGLILPERKK